MVEVIVVGIVCCVFGWAVGFRYGCRRGEQRAEQARRIRERLDAVCARG